MKTFGKIIVGCLSVFGVAFILLIGAGIYGLLSLDSFLEDQQPTAPDDAVITLDFDSLSAEGFHQSPFSTNTASLPPVLELAEGIRRAADDSRVKGLFANLSGSPLQMADIHEIREAVLAFRQTGKPTILFSETLGDGNATLDYYLASAFGEIWLQPSGSLALQGIALEIPFARVALEELGITPQFSTRHEYKSAMDSLTRASMAPEVRKNMNQLLVSWFSQLEKGIASQRQINIPQLRTLIDNAPLLANEALDGGLIDRLAYRDEVEARADELSLNRLTMGDYLEATSGAYSLLGELAESDDKNNLQDGLNAALPKVALINASGTIHRGDSDTGGPFGGEASIGGTELAATILEATEIDDLSAILLRIDSPGGSYVASDSVWRAIGQAREKGIPVIAQMGNVAASGGYFIAMAADRIVASPGSITGSIGVLSGKFVLSRLWQKLDIQWVGLMIGANAGMMSPNRRFSSSELARFNSHLDAIYADFTEKAAKARNLSTEAMDNLARGRIWTGTDAQKHGLVDAIGDYQTVLETIRTVLGLPEKAALDVFLYPPSKPPLEKLLMALEEGGGFPLAMVKGMVGLARITENLSAVAPLLESLTPILESLPPTAPGREQMLYAPMADSMPDANMR